MRAVKLALISAFLLSSLTCGTGTGSRERAREPGVSVVSLCVLGETYQGLRGLLLSVPDTGTGLTLRVVIPEGQIVDVSDAQCALTRFADDQATDLTSERFPAWDPDRRLARVLSNDRKALWVPVYSPVLPKKGARWIHAQGVVAMSVARGQATVRHEAVPIRAGSQFRAGPLDFKIRSVDGREDGGLAVALDVQGDLSACYAVEFFDDKRNLIGCHRMDVSGDDTSGVWVYYVHGQPETARVKVRYWVDKKDITIPFDVTVGLGLGEAVGPNAQ